MPIFDPDGKCPLLNKKCIKHQCIWYNMLQGKHPQSGANVQEWGCSIAWIPLLLVENTGKQVQTNSAVESFRNEMVKANMVTLALVNEQNKKEKVDPTKQVGSIWGNISESQEALQNGENPTEDIALLLNKKPVIKKGTKGKKHGRNNKQRNNK
tara:strand:+ start:1175 stop:1636 length:462 start_codon:yes stop_codon:yes gene_type:complete